MSFKAETSVKTLSQAGTSTGTLKGRRHVPVLRVVLVRAEGLLGKRGDGNSNPYACMTRL